MLPSPIATEPFPHAVLHPALPWPLYWELLANFPHPDLIAGERVRFPNHLYQLHAANVLDNADIAGCWREFFAQHTSKEWWDKVRPHCTHQPEGKLGVRYRDRCDIELDCLFGVNTAVKEHGSVKGPHLDNPREIYAMLIYFPMPDDDAGGDLGLYTYNTDKPRFFGQRMTRDVTLLKTIPYRHNSGVFFANSKHSLHGVLPRAPTDKWRRYVNVEAEYRTPLFQIP